MPRHFALSHEEHGTSSAMRVEGELDLAAAPYLRAVIGDVMGAGVRQVTVDFAATRFVDSSGLGTLLWADRRLRAVGGRLIVVNAREQVVRIFALAGLDALLVR